MKKRVACYRYFPTQVHKNESIVATSKQVKTRRAFHIVFDCELQGWNILWFCLSNDNGLIYFVQEKWLFGPRKFLFMDEISTGLHSSTTCQIVKCVGNFVHLMEATVLMALLQPAPAPETFDLLDDLVLLSEDYMWCIKALEQKCWSSLSH